MRMTILVGLLFLAPALTGKTTPAEHKVTVIGDVSTARHIAVIVPGSDVDVARFDRTVGLNAKDLYTEAGRADVAVVAWLGYTTPKGLGRDAASGELAREGAMALIDFVRALPDGKHVHVIGHSYGSVVVGLAARQLPVDDIVFLGSPGVRASSADFGTGARVWATRANDDWMRWVPKMRLGDLGHGVDPTSPSFGARPFASEGKHNEYFRPGSSSLHSLALISVGEQP